MTYFLDPDSIYLVNVPAGHPPTNRWMAPAHIGAVRPAMILLAGERLTVPLWDYSFTQECVLTFCGGLPEISADGLELELGVCSDEGVSVLARFPLLRGAESIERTVHISMTATKRQNSLYVACLAGPMGDPCADWLAIRELVIAPRELVNLTRARTFSKLRIENERAHFSRAYLHPMYQERFQRATSIDALIPSARSLATADGCSNAFDLALAWLGQRSGEDVPDFTARLRAHGQALGRPVRIASLCSGTAVTEAALIRGAGVEVELTLFDINATLLAMANQREWGASRITIHHADVNRLSLPEAAFDIVLCVSGLHHLVELEHIFEAVRFGLSTAGEFWAIGEQVGPNGNRLNPDALSAANRVFSALPARLRINQRTNLVDEELSNQDCSEATFEGIRSEEIETILARTFSLVENCRRNSFLWRIVGPDYVLNYDISIEADRSSISSLVNAEIHEWSSGCQVTELHGVYRPLLRRGVRVARCEAERRVQCGRLPSH